MQCSFRAVAVVAPALQCKYLVPSGWAAPSLRKKKCHAWAQPLPPLLPYRCCISPNLTSSHPPPTTIIHGPPSTHSQNHYHQDGGANPRSAQSADYSFLALSPVPTRPPASTYPPKSPPLTRLCNPRTARASAHASRLTPLRWARASSRTVCKQTSKGTGSPSSSAISIRLLASGPSSTGASPPPWYCQKARRLPPALASQHRCPTTEHPLSRLLPGSTVTPGPGPSDLPSCCPANPLSNELPAAASCLLTTNLPSLPPCPSPPLSRPVMTPRVPQCAHRTCPSPTADVLAVRPTW